MKTSQTPQTLTPTLSRQRERGPEPAQAQAQAWVPFPPDSSVRTREKEQERAVVSSPLVSLSPEQEKVQAQASASSPLGSLSGTRESGPEPEPVQAHAVASPSSDVLSRKREKAQDHASASSPLDSLSRTRERAGVRVRARALRKGQTDAESLLWSRLRSRQIGNLKFRRQRPIGPYFADFACLEIGLVIELDGGQHAEDAGAAHDQKRSDEMAALGFQTLRFWNNDVLLETEAVLEKILQFADTLTLALSRQREREQEHSKGNMP